MINNKSQVRLTGVFIIILAMAILALAATYRISDLAIPAILSNVECENSNQSCHLKMNETITLYYPFDINSSSNVVDDWSQYNRDSWLNRSAWVNSTGKYGWALQGNGSSYTSTKTAMQVGSLFGATWTISLWAKPNAAGTASIPTFGFNWGGNVAMVHRPLYSGTDEISFADDITWQQMSPLPQTPVGTWKHFILMDNGTDYVVYQNATYYNKAAITIDPVNNSQTRYFHVGFGGFVWDADYLVYNGEIDEFMIINRSLSPTEITQIYNQQFPRFYSQGNLSINQSISYGSNILNVTGLMNNQKNATADYTNISVGIWNNGTATWASHQNLTNGTTKSIIISSLATETNLTFYFQPDAYSFFSPVLTKNLTLSDWYDPTYITNCTTLGTANRGYKLLNSVNSTGTCFTISASNITLDCQGYVINYSTNGTLGYGVYSTQVNTTIKNCIIAETNTSTTDKYAVYFNGAYNGTIQNNTISTQAINSIGIYFWASQSHNITGNNITTSGANAHGANFDLSAQYNSLSLNNIIATSSGYGIYFNANSATNRNTASRNTIKTSTGPGIGLRASRADIIENNINTTGSLPIYSFFYSGNNNITSNTLWTSVFNSFDGCLSIGDAAPDWVYNNTIVSASAGTYGIYAVSANSKIISNNITTTGHGIFVVGSNYTISSNTVSVLGNSAYGFWLNTNSNNNTYVANKVTVTGSDSWGFYVYGGGDNNLTLNNITASGSTGQSGIYFYASYKNIIDNNQIFVSPTNTDYGAIFSYQSSNNTVRNSYLWSNKTYGYRAYSSGNTNITFQDTIINTSLQNVIYDNSVHGITDLINTTLVQSNISFGTSSLGVANIKWYLDAYANWTNSSIVNGANISSFDNTGSLAYSSLTSSSGTTRQILADYYKNATSSFYLSNYSVNGSLSYASGYIVPANVNMSTNKYQVLTFDSSNPNATLLSPANNLFTNATSINFTANITDTGGAGIKNATLYVVNSSESIVNQTTTTFSGTVNTIVGTVVTLVQGVYKWFYGLFDFAGNYYQSSNNTLTIDTTYPLVDFVSPTPASGVNLSQSWIYVNTSSSDTNNISTFVDLDSSLVSWWRMDDRNSSGDVLDYTRRNNGTNLGATYTTSGKLGGAMIFDGVDDYVLFSSLQSYSSLQSHTYSAWIKHNGGSQQYRWILNNGAFSTGTSFILYYSSGYRLAMFVQGGANYAYGDTIIPSNEWHYVSAVYNVTGVSLYVDGNNQSISWLSPMSSWSAGNSNPGLGRYYSSGWDFNGSIDDVMIFNRSLTQAEITALYANSSTKYLEKNFTSLSDGTHTIKAYSQDLAGNINSTELRTLVLDTTNPNATLISPTNNTYTNNTSQNFTANITDLTSGIKNATLYVVNSSESIVNQTTTTFSGTVNTIVGTVVTLVQGVYKWFYGLFDFAGNYYQSSNNTLTIDTTYPLVDFVSPTPENNSGKTNEFKINLTITELNLANITYSWNLGSYIFNISGANLTSILGGNFTFNITNVSSSLWIVTINQSGMSAGSSYLYFLSAKDLAGNINQTETRLIRGNAAPSINSISYTPNSTIYTDPNIEITIRANLSDSETNFDSAVLQWRNSSSSYGKNNITMNNLTSISSSWIMNTSFVLPDYQDNITFRILTNDTLGEVGYSSNYTLTSYYDCSWIFASDLSSAAGWSQVKTIGNITINNTGDIQYSSSNCSLDFRLSYDLTEGRVYFDNDYVKPSDTYTIAAGNNQTILINASFASEIKQENLNITISEFRSRSNYSSSNISSVLVTNQVGPYLYQKISTYPTSVSLKSGEEFNLVSYIRNLMGSTTININNTAYNVSFYLVLPDGITNSSGEYSTNYSNITDSNLNYLNTNLTFSDLASMSNGLKQFTLKASGTNLSNDAITDASGNSYLSESINITFLCYNVSDSVIVSSCGSLDGDYVAPTTTVTSSSSGGGGGGGSISSSEKIGEVYELIRGQEESFKFQVKNKYNSTMKNIKISVSGINAEYIKLEPSTISKLEPYQSQDIQVIITTPKYFTSRKYTLKFDIEASLVVDNLDNSYREQKTITLLVVDFTSEEASSMLEESSKWLAEMNLSGMNTEQIAKLVETINKNYKEYDFVSLKETYTSLKKLYDSAIESNKIILELEPLIVEAENSGVSVLETKRLLYLAKSAFERGDYLTSLERIKEAQLSYALETKGEFNPLYYVKNHPLESSGLLVAFLLVSYSSFLLVKLRLYKRKLILLDAEEKLIIGLMKVIQKECFDEAKMSMEEYGEAMIQYESRLNKIIQEKINTETKLAYLFKLKGRGNALFTERTRLIELIKETQKDYMERGKLETRIYENMLKGYSSRLSEVEEELALVDAKKALANKGFIGEKTSFTRKFVFKIGSFFSRKPKEIKISKIETKKSIISKPAHILPKKIELPKAKPELNLKAKELLAKEEASELWAELREKVAKPSFFSRIFTSKPKEIKVRKLSELRSEKITEEPIKQKSFPELKHKPGTKEFWDELKNKVEKPKFSFKKWFKK